MAKIKAGVNSRVTSFLSFLWGELDFDFLRNTLPGVRRLGSLKGRDSLTTMLVNSLLAKGNSAQSRTQLYKLKNTRIKLAVVNPAHVKKPSQPIAMMTVK